MNPLLVPCYAPVSVGKYCSRGIGSAFASTASLFANITRARKQPLARTHTYTHTHSHSHAHNAFEDPSTSTLHTYAYTTVCTTDYVFAFDPYSILSSPFLSPSSIQPLSCYVSLLSFPSSSVIPLFLLLPSLLHSFVLTFSLSISLLYF